MSHICLSFGWKSYLNLANSNEQKQNKTTEIFLEKKPVLKWCFKSKNGLVCAVGWTNYLVHSSPVCTYLST